MNFSIIRIVLILSLALDASSIMIVPSLREAAAVPQSGPTSWNAFGPNMKNLLITVYSDFDTMFTHFKAGDIDITDWPAQPIDLPGFSSNPDYFLTSPQADFGIFFVDFNHHNNFMGVAQQQARTVPATGINFTTLATNSCPIGMDRMIVRLKLAEAGNAAINDPLNTLVVTHATAGSPSASVTGSSTSNVYIFPCILAGPYNLSANVYSGTATIPQQLPGLNITLDFRVNYNSLSTFKPTPAGIEIRRGLTHLLVKPNFLNGATLGGLADYDDIQAPPAQGLIPCIQPPVPGPNCAPNYPSGPTTGSPSKLPQSVLDQDCAEHTWFTPTGGCHPISAYNLVNGNLGGQNVWWGVDGVSAASDKGYPAAQDVQASCDHFVAAGFSIVKGTPPVASSCAELASIASGATAPSCASQTAYTCPHLVSPAGMNKQVIMYIRTHAPRKAFGQIIGDGINFLFGSPNHQINNVVTTCAVNYGYASPQTSGNPGCAPQYYTITQIFDIVFGTGQPGGVPPGTSFIDDWNIYTAGQTLGSTPDHLWSIYNTRFSGGVCAGLTDSYPSDYPLYCDPQYDSDSNSGEFSTSLSVGNSFFARAAQTAHRNVMTIPVFSQIQQFVGLNGWNFQPGTQAGLVQQFGHGFQLGYWSLLNMRQKPGSDQVCTTPNNPPGCTSNIRYLPGGCGVLPCSSTNPGNNKNLIRRGFSQDVHKLSPFQALTLWDFEVLSQVYDSLLQVNPLTGGSGQQIIDWMTVRHGSGFNSAEVSCVGTICVTGTTTQIWHLRNDLKWHDGIAVTAEDVAYTIIAYRDVPSANLQPSVSTVSSVIALDSSTLEVKLQGQSPFYELNIGTLPIIPKHVWQPICGNPPSPASLCGTPSFDPMSSGIYIGSGAWVCKSSSGHVGGPCTSSLGQDVTLGGSILLTANENYMRGPTWLQGTSLQKLSWADKNDDGVVNILDIADAALHFGLADGYWANPIYSAMPAAGTVDIGDIATVAFYFDHGITKPFMPNQLSGMDPQVDPYRIDLTSLAGPVMYYEGGTRSVSGQLPIQLVALSGTPSPTSFTAKLTTSSGTLVSTVSGSPGGLPTIVLFPFSGVSAGRYQIQILFGASTQPTFTIQLDA